MTHRSADNPPTADAPTVWPPPPTLLPPVAPPRFLWRVLLRPLLGDTFLYGTVWVLVNFAAFCIVVTLFGPDLFMLLDDRNAPIVGRLIVWQLCVAAFGAFHVVWLKRTLTGEKVGAGEIRRHFARAGTRAGLVSALVVLGSGSYTYLFGYGMYHGLWAWLHEDGAAMFSYGAAAWLASAVASRTVGRLWIRRAKRAA